MSVFASIPRRAWVAENELSFAIRDGHPVTKGHTLVITKRETPDWFSATADERAAVMALVDVVKKQLDDELHPDGYNVGFNAGEAAGQTVMHLHVHVIPRHRGDMDDPRGGVRHVIPSKGNYARIQPAPLATGGGRDPFRKHVLPLFDRATTIAIVAAFVKETGLQLIERNVHAALARGARIRILTGDYLEITQASALQMLLDWQRASTAEDDGDAPAGVLETRIVEAEAKRLSFHPKSYRFEGPGLATAFVGSSNLSRLAFETGIEWNLRVERDHDRSAYERVRDAFEEAWKDARVLDEAWVDAYAKRAREAQHTIPPWELDSEDLPPLPPPHRVQEEALAKLRDARSEKRRRALVVLATGLGKTALAAYDHQQVRTELGARPRLLFLAHRKELLRQAAKTYRRLLREVGDHDARLGWFVDEHSDLSGDLVFASVAKLARYEHVARLAAEKFDYVVVDEVHHAAADSYRRILSAVDPGFLLGLTATPDRADAADILGSFDDFIAYRADVGRGVAIGRLVPFHYFGVKDDIDYSPENIPWRNRRFDPAALERAAETEARMETAWRAWNEHPGTRTLIFCCSVRHALFVRNWFREKRLRVAAVFSAPGSDDREDALAALESGELDAVCSVDVFNEGVDVPSVDRVVMLRPTESSVVFLQQLGRGLRASEGKTAVTVVDFVGNHRIFLERIRTLLSLAGGSAGGVRPFIEGAAAELPAGCSVELELEAKELLARLFRLGGADEIENAYRELRGERGQRPTAGELQRMGFLPSKLRERHGSWFEFVRMESDLSEEERATLEGAGTFLRELEVTEMSRSFKMVMLEAMLDAGALLSGATVRDIAIRAHGILRRNPELFADIAEDERVDALDTVSEKKWIAYWKRNPVHAWTSAKAKGRAWLRLDGDRVALDLTVDAALAPTLERMTYELVDYRLAQYRARHRLVTGDGFTCRVISNQRDPILKLPNRKTATLPEGEVDVRLPDGAVWQLRFAKEFINVARPPGTQTNKLPDLLRSPEWFGPRAGQPGTGFEVRFSSSPDGWWVSPVVANVVDLAELRGVVAYPDLRAAAGHAQEGAEPAEADRVMLPIDSEEPGLFAVRVSGTSMDGGKQPIRDGDWAVLRPMRGASISALDGRVILAQIADEAFGSRYHIKRLEQHDGAWRLTSDNPDGPTFEATTDTVPIARVERVVRPEDLAPAVGSVVTESELAQRFGLPEVPGRSGRHGGHLFVFIDAKGMLEAPDRVRLAIERMRPSETAYVLAKLEDGSWRYLGVGRPIDEGVFRVPDVDFATWRTWGSGRTASRNLPDGALARAQLAVDALIQARPRLDDRARILGLAERGGLRIDGGDDGFKERTISLTDLAWVVVADDDVQANGGLLDEERVNRVRYLEGTPKESTRWIDSKWALLAWTLARPLIRDAITDTKVQQRKVRRPGGQVIDAAFRVERVGDALTVVIESRGGTRGSAAERNVDYNEGFELLLARLGQLGIRIADAVVDSERTEGLVLEDRRLRLEYPVQINDASALRRAMSTAQKIIGRRPGAKGSGNQTRRVRLFLEATPATTLDGLAKALEG